jgi:excisionase family DNA binding protein
MIEEDRPLKIREAAERLGVDYGTIRGAIEQGLLPAIRQGDSFRILPADLLDYLERTATPPPEPKAEPPAREPSAESRELIEAREFAERARRWARRPAGGTTPPPAP